MNIFTKLIILCVFCINLLIKVNAQEKFIEGFYIDSKNDTIKGLILDKEWEVNPKKIIFKNNSNEQIELSANTIRGFGIPSKDEYFTSKSFVLIKYHKEIDEGNTPISEKIPSTYFFRIIVNSPLVNFYSLLPEEDNRTRYYIEKDENLLELENYEYLVNSKSSTYLKKVTNYKIQLANVFADCKDFNLGFIDYDENSIKEKVLNYCELKTGKTFVSKKIQSTKLLSIFTDYVPNNPSYIMVGAGYRIFFPRSFNSKFLDIEVRPGSLNTIGRDDIKKIRTSVELLTGRMYGLNKTKLMVAFGIGAPNLSFIPSIGLNINNKFAFEMRYNAAIFNTNTEKIRFLAIRLRYSLIKEGPGI